MLASWNSVDHNVREGHSRGAELYDEALRDELASTDDRASRQLLLLSWWYERFYTTSTRPHHPLRGHRGLRRRGALRHNTSREGTARAALEPEPQPLYDHGEMREIGKMLLGREGAYWRFYTRESVENWSRGPDLRWGGSDGVESHR